MTAKKLIYALITLVIVAGCAETKSDLIVLLPGADGKIGAVIVETKSGETTLLDKPYAAVRADAGGKLKKSTFSQTDIGQLFAGALAAKPPDPAYFTYFYNNGSAELTSKSQTNLEKLYNNIAGRQSAEVQVTGYASFVGDGEGGDNLALRRAKTLADMLIKKGVRKVVAAKLVQRTNKTQGAGSSGVVKVIVR